ncbi:nuclear pore complex protein Nup107-like isoform X1 [Temnothorax curvispinosus]|uniref:Nuclear pore complex protein n=1 Tax=Temnothorax curvispinosus TaxID=300111 RepID=A0A6J1QUJ8_9HYME|nr:nuclear pore complex protein Nup107-like isoform X1 [Temnothorax curvispinosus]
MDCTLTNLTIPNNLSKKAAASIRDYLYYKTYLDAQEGFGKWFSQNRHGKPTPPEELPMYATFTEKVASDPRKTQYNSEFERWKSTMQHTKRLARRFIRLCPR